MIRLILILTILLSACTTKEDPSRPNMNPEFVPYIQEIETEIGDSINIDIDFYIITEDQPFRIGECRYGNEGNTVAIKYDAWYRLTYEEKILLLIHEVGHCKYYLDHYLHFDKNRDCPVSAMHTPLPDLYCARNYFRSYIREFRERIKNS